MSVEVVGTSFKKERANLHYFDKEPDKSRTRVSSFKFKQLNF